MVFAVLLHILGVVIWVGGMFFAHQILRPVAAELLAPPQRLPLWVDVFGRFFPMVWVSVLMILFSGLYLIMQLGGFRAVALGVHLMFGIGLVMILIFCFVYFVYYAKLAKAVAAQEWKRGGEALAAIRRLVGFNLGLGLFNIAVAIVGRMAS